MTQRLADVLESVQDLSPEERKAFDVVMVEQLDGAPQDGEAEVTWTPEVERRTLEALRGENLVGDIEDVLAQVRARLRAPRRKSARIATRS